MESAKAIQMKKQKSNDICYTPVHIARLMIAMCKLKEGDRVLDPCCGKNGVFFNNFPSYTINDWCEIENNRDFFDYNGSADIIVGNPPFSLFAKWIDKTLQLNPQKICYIFGSLNLTTARLNKFKAAGYGITAMHIFKNTYWFGDSFCVLFEKGAESIMSLEPATIMCENCGHRCKRVVPNVCGKLNNNEKSFKENK